MRFLKFLLVATIFALAGCAANNSQLSAPCPNYGASCHQTPINSWDFND